MENIVVTHSLVKVSLTVRRTARGQWVVTRCHLAFPDPGDDHWPGNDHPVGVAIRSLLEGDPEPVGHLVVDDAHASEFTRRVLRAARTIEYGTTETYGGLAVRAGVPRAVRAVASVMRHNDFPLIVPCHRVVRSDGTIGGFMGKQRGACIALKQALLDRERANGDFGPAL